MNGMIVSKLLDKILEIAEKNNDAELIKWLHLESEGYNPPNPYLNKDDVIPEYRAVAGENRDMYHRPLIIQDPRALIVNIYRLRHPVVELESLVESKSPLLTIRDPDLCKIIKDNLKVEVCEFVFTPTSIKGVLNSIKEEAIRRAEKYVTRTQLFTAEKETDEKMIPSLDQMTIRWLISNVPVSMWVKFLSALLASFLAGVYLSGIPLVKGALQYLPGYKIDMVLPPNSAEKIEKQMSELINAHNTRLQQLQVSLLYEEKLSNDHALIPSYRDQHRDGAERIRKLINDENSAFQQKLKELRSFLGK